ncbi:hypothetical protein VIBNIAM115_1370001 [Vibrio nigripulchritudo AM115]|nr:hypothetical protein VIBNIAM115_1370001 [Vibrio nigripulchritudo AM115]
MSERQLILAEPSILRLLGYKHDDIIWINDALRKIKLPDDLQPSE